jgi:MFS transporter, DHA3 family, macrolide efflux protein
MQETTHKPTGMLAFLIILVGQLFSVLASSMSHFALTIWMYQQTESAFALGMMQVFFITPFLIISPFAGVMVDRYNRKAMMMVSDLAAAIATGGIFVLYALGMLEFWHLYVAAVLNGIGNTFQWPAYSAAISTMIPKEQLGRANGLMSLMEAGPGVVAPLLAGMLLPLIGLVGILAIDIVTFFFAIGTLLFVHIPQPRKTEEGQQKTGNIWSEAAYGFTYIFARPSLLGLQLIFFFGNLFSGIGFTLLAPMILARTDSNSLIFGSVQSAGAIGAVAGGVLMSIWGGFKRRVHGVLLGWILFSLSGMLFLGIGQGLAVWIPAMVIMSLCGPLINASNQAIWQSKVAPDLQGRVFSARRLIAWFAQPVSPIIAGTLADFAFEPAMRGDGMLSQTFGVLVGTGPGAGMGLILVFCSLAAALVGLTGYFIPAIRNAEDLLTDHDTLKDAE